MKHIRIISPSGAIEPQFINGAHERLESWGYQVSEGRHARSSFGGLAGTDDERLADLNEALQDPSIDIVLCSRGGYGLCRILDRVELNPDHVPLVVGYSDITCLHNLMGVLGEKSLHAIMAKHITTLPDDAEPIIALKKLLEDKEVEYAVRPHDFNRIGSASGVLRGGNLQVGYGLRGTPFDYMDDGRTIFFMEDIHEPAHAIDRVIRSLRMSGMLEQLQGLIVGQFTDCKENVEDLRFTIYQSIRDAVADYDFPVCFNFPAGHVEHNLPLMLNTACSLQVNEQEVILKVNE